MTELRSELRSEHRFIIRQTVRETPCTALPDGAITGNGDVTVVLGGTADRIRLHIGKADFWKADGRVYTAHLGGISPLCTARNKKFPPGLWGAYATADSMG